MFVLMWEAALIQYNRCLKKYIQIHFSSSLGCFLFTVWRRSQFSLVDAACCSRHLSHNRDKVRGKCGWGVFRQKAGTSGENDVTFQLQVNLLIYCKVLYSAWKCFHCFMASGNITLQLSAFKSVSHFATSSLYMRQETAQINREAYSDLYACHLPLRC